MLQIKNYLHRFDVISHVIVTGHNELLNTIGIVPVYACKGCDALVASCATTD